MGEVRVVRNTYRTCINLVPHLIEHLTEVVIDLGLRVLSLEAIGTRGFYITNCDNVGHTSTDRTVPNVTSLLSTSNDGEVELLLWLFSVAR